MEVHRILSTSNYEFANFTMVLGNLSNGASSVNMTIDFFQKLLKIPVYLTFSVPADKKDENFSKIILKVTINICRILDGVAGDFFSKMIENELKRIASNSFKCPIQKGNYKLDNFIMRDNFLPSYLFTQDIKYLVNAKVMAKVANQKNLVLLFTARSYGLIFKN